MRQTDLEREMVELGKGRYWSAVNKAREQGLESTVGPGHRLLSESVLEMTKAVKSWVAEANTSRPGRRHAAIKYMSKLQPKVVAAITSRCILDCISQQKKITSTAIKVARLLEDEVKFLYLKEHEPALWKHIHRQLDRHKSYDTKAKFIKNTANYNKVILGGWPKKDAVAVGMVCIELLRQSTGLIDIVTRKARTGRSVTMVTATPDLMEWIKKAHKHNELLKPVLLPMTEPPIDWGQQRTGGYLDKSLINSELVTTRSKSYKDELEQLGMPKVYNCINKLQRTGFVVDKPQLEVMRHFWNQGLTVGGLPSPEDNPLPTKPLDIETNPDTRKEWKKAAAKVHFENERQQSKRLQVAKVFWLADKFKYATLYYPHVLDFRARVYPKPYFLQPQGPSYAKSLLRFKKGMPILDDNAASWLAMYVANSWGEDKKPFNERMKWVEENTSMIQRIAADPLRNREWEDADDPWPFLSCCREWASFLGEGLGFVSNLPIPQDATTQGLQIYAKILLDPVAGLATNVLPSDRPNDLYQQVADTVIAKLAHHPNPYASKWLAFGIDRSTTKRQAMTLTYGSVFFSCKEYTTEWFYDKLREGRVNVFGDETYRPCNFLAEVIWESISEVVKSARLGMDWLREVASICMDNDTMIRWFTPLGFLVKMDYPVMGKYEVKTTIGTAIRQHRYRMPKDNMNKRKNVNSIAANLIHSYDGAGGLLGEAVHLATEQGIDDFKMQHDCGAVHAANSGIFAGCVRQAAVNIFTPNLFQDFKQQIVAQLPSGVTIPEPPERGNMDLSQVLDSQYYWN